MEFGMVLADLKSVVADLRPHHFAPIVLWGFWFIALFTSLKGVDRRDDITQIGYVAVILALGVILLIALPTVWKWQRTPRESSILIVFFILAARARWIIAGAKDPEKALAVKSTKGK